MHGCTGAGFPKCWGGACMSERETCIAPLSTLTPLQVCCPFKQISHHIPYREFRGADGEGGLPASLVLIPPRRGCSSRESCKQWTKQAAAKQRYKGALRNFKRACSLIDQQQERKSGQDTPRHY
uniref:Uncharacterized protein n=1 Tax=Terrapene triunguis TaxID=2587831 RepID=A0A674JWF2_9SAUR